VSTADQIAYSFEIGVPSWLWTLVYARRQAAPLLAALAELVQRAEEHTEACQ